MVSPGSGFRGTYEESDCEVVRIVISCPREDQGDAEQTAFGSDLESGLGTALA